MRKVFLMSALLALLALPATSWGQDPGAPDPGMQDPAQASDLMTAEGALSKVDPGSQTIWIKASDGSEKSFLYTDQTQVVGADGTVEGLANESGKSVRIEFQSSAGANTALKIEVL